MREYIIYMALIFDISKMMYYFFTVANPPKRRGEQSIFCSMLAFLWTVRETPGGTRRHIFIDPLLPNDSL